MQAVLPALQNNQEGHSIQILMLAIHKPLITNLLQALEHLPKTTQASMVFNRIIQLRPLIKLESWEIQWMVNQAEKLLLIVIILIDYPAVKKKIPVFKSIWPNSMVAKSQLTTSNSSTRITKTSMVLSLPMLHARNICQQNNRDSKIGLLITDLLKTPTASWIVRTNQFLKAKALSTSQTWVTVHLKIAIRSSITYHLVQIKPEKSFHLNKSLIKTIVLSGVSVAQGDKLEAFNKAMKLPKRKWLLLFLHTDLSSLMELQRIQSLSMRRTKK